MNINLYNYLSSITHFFSKPKPVRLQRKTVKGSKLVSPNGLPIVYLQSPSIFRNPFKATISGEKAVKYYRKFLLVNPLLRLQIKKELRGKNLACYCPLNKSCHADILLEIANS